MAQCKMKVNKKVNKELDEELDEEAIETARDSTHCRASRDMISVIDNGGSVVCHQCHDVSL